MSFEAFLEEKQVEVKTDVVVESKEIEVEIEEVDLTEAEKKAKLKKSYTIKFEVVNDAFVEDFDGEVEAVLKQAIKNIQRDNLEKPLRDTNGNVVGSVK